LVTELSPLSTDDLSKFSRSTVSSGVLRNLLAHVVAAETESDTSDQERRDAITDDWSFGPEEVGDIFSVAAQGEEKIDAARMLLDLHEHQTSKAFCSVRD
jgi:hypothetical protein